MEICQVIIIFIIIMQKIKKYHIKPMHKKPSQKLYHLKIVPECTDLPRVAGPLTSKNTKLAPLRVPRKMASNQSNTNLPTLNNSRLNFQPQVSPTPTLSKLDAKRSVMNQHCLPKSSKGIIEQRIRLSKLDEVANLNKPKEDLPINVSVNYATVESKAYMIRKRKCNIIKSNPSVFQLPTEESYNKMNELFDSIKSLVQKPEHKNSIKERLNTATTDATEKQTQELHLDDLPEELQELSLEEDLFDLSELKNGLEESERIELVPSLKRDEFVLKLGVGDIMFIEMDV